MATNAEQRHANKARKLIEQSLRDLDRGDRLDALDSLTLASDALRKSRASTVRRVLRSQAGAK